MKMLWARTGLMLLTIVAGSASVDAGAGERASATYSLADILSLALERNPAVAGATGLIEETRGRHVTAGAYPNPTIQGQTGVGQLRETGRAAPGAVLESPPGSLWEYNFTVGQPIEWPSMRAARRGAAEAGVSGAAAGLDDARVNLAADVQIAFYELLVAQRHLELATQNLDIVEDVQRIVDARVRLGEAAQFEAIKADVEVLKAR